MAYDPRMNSLPLFVSFPRTGAHWINCVMELYFDRPRLRQRRTTFLDRTRTDWRWFHDHDENLDLHQPKVLFLYREPIATIFSNLNYERQHAKAAALAWWFYAKPETEAEAVRRHCYAYRSHCEKWLLSESRARTVVRHDNFLTHRAEEFGRICEHFGEPLDHERIEQAFQTVTPEALVARAGNTAEMGSHMLGQDYRARRREFEAQWGDFIREQVLTSELGPFFEGGEGRPRSVAARNTWIKT